MRPEPAADEAAAKWPVSATRQSRYVDPVRIGLALRSLRRRRGWTQAQLGARASVSQSAVSRAERGDAADLTVRTLARIASALGARVTMQILFQGAALDRLLDATHAGLVNEVVTLLRAGGWEAVPEATFSAYGERGSIDVLAFHPATGSLLVVEVKSVVPDMQAMLAGVDRKVRLAPAIARERGWAPRNVSRLLVLPEDRTARRRVATLEATFDQAFPARTVAARRWIASPVGVLAAILFLPSSQRTTGRHRLGRPGPGNRSDSA
jgi:transcriptional regulator with XRE-family HTH domain